MKFKVEELQHKPLSELHNIFSAIPRTDNVIFFEGYFNLLFYGAPKGLKP